MPVVTIVAAAALYGPAKSTLREAFIHFPFKLALVLPGSSFDMLTGVGSWSLLVLLWRRLSARSSPIAGVVVAAKM